MPRFDKVEANQLRVRTFNIAVNAASTFNKALFPARDGGYVQVNVTVAGATLNLSLDADYTPSSGDLITIIIDQEGVTQNLIVNWSSDFLFPTGDELPSTSASFPKTMWEGVFTTLGTDAFLMKKYLFPP